MIIPDPLTPLVQLFDSVMDLLASIPLPLALLHLATVALVITFFVSRQRP